MKKEYKKPELLFDSFELSECIAKGCSIKTNHTTETCGNVPGIGTLWSSDSCTFKVGDDNSDNFCYNVPTEGNKLFTS